MRKNKTMKIISTLLLFAMLVGIIPNATFAAPLTKKMVVNFEELFENNNIRSKSVTIPRLKNLLSVKTSNGDVTHSLNGEKVTLNVGGGNPSRQVNNPTKHKKLVTDVRICQGSNSNPATISYSNDGYFGTLNKGTTTSNQVQTGGSYIPAHSKYVQSEYSENYNQDGYTGRLEAYEDGGRWRNGIDAATGDPIEYWDPYIRYRGTVRRPGTSDTRTWRTDYTSQYSGTVYKAGLDNYYEYLVIIEYLDNFDPIINITSAADTKHLKDDKFSLSGTITDTDINQSVTVSATIGGVVKSKMFNTPVINKEWTLVWDITDIPEGEYTNIEVIVTDTEAGTASARYTGSIIVDKVSPVLTLTPSETNPTNKDVIITVESTDNLSGIAEIELHDNSIVKVSKTTFIVKENGTYDFKVTDKAGNVTSKSIEISNINKVLPVITVEGYILTPTNQDITVTVKTDKGSINKNSYTFTENGSFEFIATDIYGNIAKETVTITNIDKIAPVITFKDYKKTPTNKSILVEAIASKGSLNFESHLFTDNGSFKFIATDEAGNITKETVTITNIDKIAPVITVGDYNIEPTNQNVTVTVTADKGTFNKNSHIFEENGSFEFIVTDAAGNVSKERVTITNINKVLPVIKVEDYIKTPTNENITIKVTANKGTFNQDSHTFTENGSFEFIVTDKHGNVSKQTVTITNIDKTAPSKPVVSFINDKIVLTEASDNESGIEKHKYSINNSPFENWTSNLDAILFEDGTYKIVVKAIDKASNETLSGALTITTSYRKIENAITKAEETLDRDDYDKAKDLVNGMEDGDLKDDLLGELEDILDKVEEKEFEDLIGGDVTEEDLKDIEEAIKDSNLPEEVKNDLIDKVNDKALELATASVVKAEDTLTQEDHDLAKEKVEALVPSQGKTDLEERLQTVQDQITSKEVEDLIGDMDSDENYKDIEDAITNSNASEDVKADLIAKLNKKALELATKLVIKAENTLTRDDYDIAKGKVDALVPSEGKVDLVKRLKDVLDKIEEREFGSLIGGMEKVEDIKNAGDKIKDSDLPEDVKEDLLDQLDKKIRELTSWSIGIAEAVSREPYLGTAQAFIDLLKESPEKDAFQTRMDAIDVKLTTNTELALKDAERVVALAETNKREASVDNAKKVVKALQPSAEKIAFEVRLQDLEDALAEEIPVLEVVNTKTELQRAEESVVLAEKIKREAAINSARKVVNNLKDSAEKTAFIERLDSLHLNK